MYNDNFDYLNLVSSD